MTGDGLTKNIHTEGSAMNIKRYDDTAALEWIDDPKFPASPVSVPIPMVTRK